MLAKRRQRLREDVACAGLLADPVVPGGPYVNEMVPKGALRIQLDTVKASGANGVVIWGTLGNTQARLR